MASQLTLAYPGDLDTLTGGYLYDKRILAELAALGWVTHKLSLDPRFPNVTEQIKQSTCERLANVDPNHTLVIDGLALGALGPYAKAIRAKRPFVALVHHPLALESGIEADLACALHESEQAALKYADHIIVTSRVTQQTLIEQFNVPALKISVVEPGVDHPAHLLSNPFTQRLPQDPVRLLSVGALVARKGFDVLIKALGTLAELDWQLTIVGDQERSPACTSEINHLIRHFNITSKVKLVGALATHLLAQQYEQADLFVLASRYEGYGMAYTEALAWGLPVVGTDGGAAAQTLATPAAKIVPVDDADTLAATLRTLISDHDLRQTMRQAAREHAQQLPNWQASGLKFAHAISAKSTLN